MDETPAQQPGTAAPGPGAAGTTPPGAADLRPDPYADPYAGADPGPSTGADTFFDNVRRIGLVRSEERWVGGVAGGLAMRLGIDPLIVRGLFGIGVLLGGLGLIVYGVGWLLMPEQRDGRIHLQQLFRGDFDAAVIGGFAAILIGFGVPDGFGMPWWGGHRNGWWGGLLGLAAAVIVIAVIASSASRGRGHGPTTSLPRTPPGPYGPYAGPSAGPYAGPYAGPSAGPAPAPFGPAPHPGPGRPPHDPAAQAAGRPTEGLSMPTPPPAAPAPAPYQYGTGPGGYGPYPAQPGPQSGPQSGPQYGGPYGPGRAPVPPVPPGPRTSLPPKPGGPGVRPVGIVVALSLLVLAGLLYAERVGSFDHPVVLTAAAVMVILAGLGVAVAGVLGRTSGGLGGLAVVTLLVIVPIGAVSTSSWSNTTFVGDVSYRPTDIASAEDGYSILAGTVVLDLTDLPASADPVEIPVRLLAGDLRVVIPEDADVTARVRQTAGDFAWLDDPLQTGVAGADWQTYTSSGDDGREIELEISMGAGSLRVVEGS